MDSKIEVGAGIFRSFIPVKQGQRPFHQFEGFAGNPFSGRSTISLSGIAIGTHFVTFRTIGSKSVEFRLPRNIRQLDMSLGGCALAGHCQISHGFPNVTRPA